VCPCHLLFPRPPVFFPVWVTVDAISVQTPQNVFKAARGKSVTLPCTYSTSAPDRDGFIQWDKLLRSHSVRLFKTLGALWEWVSPDHDLAEGKHHEVLQ
jgi:hypothetical protein